MNIIYISSSIIPSKYANSVHVMKMCSAFAENNNQVTLICRRGDKKLDDYKYYGVKNNFKIKKIWWPKIKGGGLIYGFLCRLFLKNNPKNTIVYSRSIYGTLSAVKKNIPCIFEAHTPPRNKIHYKMEKKLFYSPKFKRLVVITKALADEYKKIFPILKTKEIIIAHDAASEPTNSNFSQKNIYGKNSLKVGYVGSLYPGRGIETIFCLAKECKNIDFHIIGGDDQITSNWRKKISKLNNIFFYGYISHGNLSLYVEKFDIMIAPYQLKVYTDYREKNNTAKWMSPLKIFEYMSYGKPIITSDFPVLQEVLTNNKNALLCNPEIIEEWIKALDKLKDKNLREYLGQQAKKEFLEKYTWKKRSEIVLKNLKLND